MEVEKSKEKYAPSSFHPEIPRWGRVFGIILLIAAQYLVSGLNGNIGPRVTSYFGLDSSKVSFFLHISTVGMVVMFPLTYRFRAFFRRIHLLLWVLGLELLICLLCYATQNEFLLLISSLLMGALKIICILDFLSMIIGLFPFMRNRGLMYGCFYAFSRIMREISTFVTLKIVESYNWPSIFLLSAGVSLFSIVIVLLLFQRKRVERKIPLYRIDWLSVFSLLIAGISMCYFLIMGREKNWFSSERICATMLLFVVFMAFFVYRQFHYKRPFWNLRVFLEYKQIPLGLTIMLLIYLFYQSSILFNTFIDYNFSNQEDYLADVTLIQISSYLLAFPLAGYLFYKGFSKRLLLCFGFFCYAISLFNFSFSIQPALELPSLFLSIFLGGIAYGFTLTTAAAFTATNVSRKDNKDRAMGSISSRYVLGSFIGSSLYGNWLFRGIQHHKDYLSAYINPSRLPFISQWHKLQMAFQSKGFDAEISRRQALAIIQQKTHLQAMLITVKEITWILGICAVMVAITVLFIRRLEMHKIKGQNKYRIIPW